MATARAIGEELTQLRAEQAALFAKAKQEDGSLELSPDDAAIAEKRNKDIAEKAEAYKKATDLETMASDNDDALKHLTARGQRKTSDGDPGAPADERPSQGFKSLGELVIESEAFKSRRRPTEGVTVEIDLAAHYGKQAASHGLKTLFNLASAAGPEPQRLPTPITPGEQEGTVAGLMPQGRTSSNAVSYLEETTTTPGASETDESGEKPEAALAFTERLAPVVKIAVTLPVTDESLADNDFIESYINNRLRAFVLQREDSQLLNGSGAGTPTQLKGILSHSIGSASGGDNSAEAIMFGITEVWTESFLPSTAVVMHPVDWQDIRLLREGDGTGTYLMGPPSVAGADTIWGLDVVLTTAIAEGTALVGNFRLGAQIFRRSDIAVAVGYVDDQFRLNQRTIRVEERLALAVFRPSAFAEVTLGS